MAAEERQVNLSLSLLLIQRVSVAEEKKRLGKKKFSKYFLKRTYFNPQNLSPIL